MKLMAKARLLAAPIKSKQSFLPTRLVMIDCEMTGLDPVADEILQIAALKLILRPGSIEYEVEGPELNIAIHSDLQPNSEFARTHLTEIYRRSNESQVDYVAARLQLEQWLGDWIGEVSPCGDCVPTDIMFLKYKDVISCSRFDDDTPVPGTFHYEFWDMNAIKLLARTRIGSKFDKELPRLPGDHDALVDCYNQLTEMNAFIRVLLS